MSNTKEVFTSLLMSKYYLNRHLKLLILNRLRPSEIDLVLLNTVLPYSTLKKLDEQYKVHIEFTFLRWCLGTNFRGSRFKLWLYRKLLFPVQISCNSNTIRLVCKKDSLKSVKVPFLDMDVILQIIKIMAKYEVLSKNLKDDKVGESIKKTLQLVLNELEKETSEHVENILNRYGYSVRKYHDYTMSIIDSDGFIVV